MSQAIDALSTAAGRVPSSDNSLSPDAALLALRARWQGLRAARVAEAPGAFVEVEAEAEARLLADILALPAHTVAGVAGKMAAALAAPEDGGRLRPVIAEGLPIIEAALAGAARWERYLPMARAMAAFAGVTLAPDVLADGPPAPETVPTATPAAPAPEAPQSWRVCGPIELDILHRALVGWVAGLSALQLSMEHDDVAPAAFDAIVSSIQHWRDTVGKALPAAERTPI